MDLEAEGEPRRKRFRGRPSSSEGDGEGEGEGDGDGEGDPTPWDRFETTPDSFAPNGRESHCGGSPRRGAALFMARAGVVLVAVALAAGTAAALSRYTIQGDTGTGISVDGGSEGKGTVGVEGGGGVSGDDGDAGGRTINAGKGKEGDIDTVPDPGGRIGTRTASSAVPLAAVVPPFPAVDRAEYGDPVSSALDISLFDPSLISDGWVEEGATVNGTTLAPAPFLKVPFPTGAFWTNLVVKTTGTQSYPSVCYPYAYEWDESTLKVSYPFLRRQVDDISIRDYFAPDLTLGAAEDAISRHVTAFDPLSATVRFLLQPRDDVDQDKKKGKSSSPPLPPS